MRNWIVVTSLGLLLAVSGTVFAAEGRSGRYTMAPADDGFVRLDTETGAMSLCTRKNGQWSCAAMPESQDDMRRALERLEAENKVLKEDLRRADEALGLGDPGKQAEGPLTGPRGELKLPSEQDLDKAFDYFERMIKKFRDRMQQFEGPDKGSTPL